MMEKGYLALVLHAHLPFVRHPEYDWFLEEDWLYEAITETYIPLILMMEGLERDKVEWRLTMTISPPLASMLKDELLRARYFRHLMKLSELVDKELIRTKFDGHLHYLANHYREKIDFAISTWEKWNGDLIEAFKYYQNTGKLEIMTCAATHGYLPLMQIHPEAVWAQIKVAFDHYISCFGREPKGIWLPECGYYEGLDIILKEAGLRFFVMDSHGVLFATPKPKYDNYAPIFCPESGVAAFGRDLETSLQVWSQEHGYPGDPVYREFYRDIGYDLDYEYIKPYIQPTGARKNTGIKYHRITGKKSEHKELYDPYWAKEKAAVHAGNFMFNRERQIEYLFDKYQRRPIVVSPYDAELFGHWWYEGPWWLDFVIRKSVYDQKIYRLTTLSEYLKENPTQQVALPAQSSWGDKGYHEFWLNGKTDWIYPHLHKAEELMIASAYKYRNEEGIRRRILNQLARELLLAQSSDWAFIISSGTMVEYAVKRVKSHIRRFLTLYQWLESGNVDEQLLSRIEYVDNIFPEIDYSVYAMEF